MCLVETDYIHYEGLNRISGLTIIRPKQLNLRILDELDTFGGTQPII